MKFSELYRRIDESNKTNEKLSALVDYFAIASDEDAAWAVFFLTGRRLPQPVPSKVLRRWATEEADIPPWLFEETYAWVGDLAETMSCILPPPKAIVEVDLGTTKTSESVAKAFDSVMASESPIGSIDAGDIVEAKSAGVLGSTCSAPSNGENQSLHRLVEEIISLRGLDESGQRALLTRLFSRTAMADRFPIMKLITGGMRVGVSRGLVVRALASHCGLTSEIVTHRLMGNWEPSADSYRLLTNPDTTDAMPSRPYPFALANSVEMNVETLGSIDEFQFEWKWDGIRSQLIRRDGKTFLWSRGEERLDGKYPEIEIASERLETNCVLDGEILAWKGELPLPFAELQRRIGRKTVGKKLLQEVPIVFLAFDLLEVEGEDWRSRTQRERREKLVEILDGGFPPLSWKEGSNELEMGAYATNASTDDASLKERRSAEKSGRHQHIRLSPVVKAASWEDFCRIRNASREMKTEGLMLKRVDSPYPVGRVRGHWWKWKIEPYTIDAVLIYAQRGHGRRAALYTDFTFALWDNNELVPFAKAYSGLSDRELAEVDRFVRVNTLEKFGPVRSVTPQLVMELAFENIQLSNRHKSGLAVRFPRIVRWRHDKKVEDADRLEDLKRMVSP